MSSLIRKLLGLPSRRRIRLPGLPPFRMETHGEADIYVSNAIERWGIWEPSSTAIMQQLCAGSVDFIDIGANIGWYTLVAAQALKGRGHVHAFEPDPAHVARLKANLALNRLDNVTVNAWALSDGTGNASFHLNAANRGDNSLFPGPDRARAIRVELRRLDDYAGLAANRSLVVKIDVQGAELDVLSGAEQLLTTHPHEIVLICEMSPANLEAAGRSAAELGTLLNRLGFAAALIEPKAPRVTPMSWERLVEHGRTVPDSDFLAFRRIDGLMAPLFRGGHNRR